MKFRNGIIIAMIAFVAFIVTMALVINSKKSELISEDYYIQEKSFNADFDAQQRSADMKNPIKLIQEANGIRFVNQSKLNIQKIDLSFVLMNDGGADFSLKHYNVNDLITKDNFTKGMYEIQMRYSANKLPFMQVVTWQYK
ncbi:MAG: FixH [Bacteroidota bacterium]|jgi:hypothetical protein